jgi:cytochrome c-type biogenesis protein CcmH/NrfG
MWGEALMQKNRSDLALAKFAEADKYAPNWGRLHLKWGEALAYAGRKAEAKAQFAIASGFDLAPSDRSRLASPRTTHD